MRRMIGLIILTVLGGAVLLVLVALVPPPAQDVLVDRWCPALQQSDGGFPTTTAWGAVCPLVLYAVWLVWRFAPVLVLLLGLWVIFTIIGQHRQRVERRRRAVVTDFQALDPYEFEGVVCDLLRAMGYTAPRVNQRSRDGGFDITATSPRLKGGLLLVECKRYARGNKVGVQLVRQFHGVMQKKLAYEGWFVTTSDFTKDALEHAEAVQHLRLINGQALARLYQQYS